MKKIIFASGLLALMMAATACGEYDIYPEEFDGVFSIKGAGTRELTVYATDATAEVPFIVLKGGYDPKLSADATLKVMDEDEFAAYQETSGSVNYVRIGDECFSFSPTDNVYSVPFKFEGENTRYEATTLYVRPKVLKTWLEEHAAELEGKSPVVPVTLLSDEAVNVNGNTSMVVIDLRTPALTFDVDAIVSRTIDSKSLTGGESDSYRPEANISIPCSNPWGFTLNFVTDNQVIADYNAANGTTYEALPADKYTLKTAYHFEPGTTGMPLDLSINLKDLRLLKTYAVAITLDKNNPVTWDSEDTPGEDLVIDPEAMTVIFTVRVKDIVKLEPIMLSTANVTTDDQDPAEGPLSGLFDNDTNTYFHSNYHAATQRDATYGSYLQIDFGAGNEKSLFRFTLANRNSPTVNGYVKTVRLFGTNDLDNWPVEPFAEITGMNETGLLDGAAKSADFGTDEEPFEASQPYRYLRFCVMASGGGSLGQPSTSIYWCASELDLYGY